ncbi:hypothetical protein A3860_00575 [Niastella vici]|uniref:Glycosyltransferase 2-like domain-containing protein n=1 Tax=Niastella vici TaxID=1703345 RepID=A0A1V9G8U2_9BACT|nr:glycosyltransferase [Niastella vici]OQP66898.1 hypothetical protein A3860_00575 [Niastella vici]
MSNSSKVLVSIVIPVKNGDYWLSDTLKGLLSQKINGGLEVIIIDSGSTDSSLDIITQFPVRLIQIDAASFNHGLTRNLGVKEAKGEFVIMTVQDAKPVDEFWVQHLLNGFEEESVAGVCGQQIVPWEKDKNPVAWFRPQSDPQLVKYNFTPDQFNQLHPTQKRTVCGWDNVCAIYRKKILEEIPFREVMFAEDCLWAREAILKGYSIAYNPKARVYHYHYEEPASIVKRLFAEYYHFYRFLGFKPSYTDNGFIRKLKDIKLLVKEREVTWPDKWKWFWYNLAIREKVNETIDIFNQSVSEGEDALLKKYKLLCDQIPQAHKPV